MVWYLPSSLKSIIKENTHHIEYVYNHISKDSSETYIYIHTEMTVSTLKNIVSSRKNIHIGTPKRTNIRQHQPLINPHPTTSSQTLLSFITNKSAATVQLHPEHTDTRPNKSWATTSCPNKPCSLHMRLFFILLLSHTE